MKNWYVDYQEKRGYDSDVLYFYDSDYNLLFEIKMNELVDSHILMQAWVKKHLSHG